MALLLDLLVTGQTRLNDDTYAKNIYADKFIRTGSSDNYVLLGGGGHKLISDFATAGHNHDGRYIRWGGSAADTNAMSWGTLTTANGYTILSHVSSSDGGDWGMVNKGGQIFMQLDGYYYQNEGRNRVTDVTETVTALSTSGNYITWTKNGTTNNITVPYATYASTASKATNADKLGNITASEYFKNKDVAFNSDWSEKFLWTIWDNHLYAADKRFAVTLNGVASTDGSYNPLFDGSFETSIKITEAQSVLHIKHTTEGNVWTYGLPYGSFYVVFYYSDAENVTGRVYCNYAEQGIGWHDLNATHISRYVWKLDNRYYQLSDLEITITKPSSASYLYLCQILHEVERSAGPYYAAVMSKYCNQNTDYSIKAAKFIGPLQGNADTAGNADTVDNQHFAYSNSSDSPTYLWASNSNGSSFLAARAKISVNYANSAGSAGSVAWGNVTNKPSSFTPSSHTHDYLPLAGGTMTGAINLSSTNAKLAFGSLATSPITGYKAPSLVSNGVGIYSRYGGSSDEGAIIITEDTCVIYNSSDTGWNFQVMDKDLGTDMTNDATRSFGVNQHHQAWSLGGFVKSGSSDSYVLLGGGGHKALSDFSNAATATSLGPGALKHMCSLYATNTYNAYKITTDWHRSNNAMPTINIRGYAYGTERTIDCDIVMYHYNNDACNYSLTNKGSYPIRVWQAIENNVQVFYINPGEYFGMFNVFVYGGMGTGTFSNWSMITVDAVSGTEIYSKPIATSITGNADTVDNQHFSYSNDSNSPTYLWATNSNGSSFLAARSSLSVNYANSAGSAGSVAWGNITGKPSTFPVATHNHDDKYVKLNGTSVMTGDLTLSLGDVDRFIVFSYNGTTNPASNSWRTGVLGSGRDEANYYVVQYQRVNTSSSNWNTAFKIGQVTGNVTFTNNIAIGDKVNYYAGNLTPKTITLSTSAQTYITANGTNYTLKLPNSDPYTSARTPTAHTHYATIFKDSRNETMTPAQGANVNGIAIDFKTKANGVGAGSGYYCGLVTFDPYADVSGGYPMQMGFNSGPDTNNTNEVYIRTAKDSSTWNTWRTIINDTNYTSYTVKKDGTGATGTWGINISGSAGSVAWANIAGKPTSFAPASHNHDTLYVKKAGDTMTGDLHVYAHTYCGYGTGSSVIDYNVYAMYVGTNGTRTGTAGSYIGGIAFTHMIKYSGGNDYCNSPQGWIGLRTVDYPGSERSSLVFATKPGTGTSNTGDDIPIERMCITPAGNVGVGTINPSTYKLEVNGDTYSTGYVRAASGFVKGSSSNDYVLLGGGGHKAVSDFTPASHNHDTVYLPRLRMRNPSNGTNAQGGIPFPISLKGAGYPVYIDPEFTYSNNSVIAYKTSGDGTVTITRIADNQGASNSSGKILQISSAGTIGPGRGGFVQEIKSRANAVFAQIFRAKIPTGFSVVAAENSMGSGHSTHWLTDTAGTGKWEWYIRVTICGASGTFSSGGHVYLSGSGSVTWYLSYCNLIDLTKGKYDGLRTRDADYADRAGGTDEADHAYYADEADFATSASHVTVSNSNSQSTYRMVFHSGNTLYSTAGVYCNPSTSALYATAFYESSDQRLKNFHNSLDVNLDKLKSIPKKYFSWKKDNDSKLHIGTSAQAIREIYPELVSESDDGMLSVDYAKLSIVALKAVDKLYEMNKNLERRIQILESKKIK